MCPCQPLNDANFHPPTPPSGIAGFAVSIPDLNIQFPDIPLQDLTALFNQLSLLLPSGTLRPNLDGDVFNKPFSAFLTLLNQLMPFLMLYKFLLPIPTLILCILEVLCAIPSPFKVPAALSKLFRTCLPAFLSLFPFLALILLIITLLLLILALIAYLIQRILAIIATIILNIEMLASAAKRLDNDSIIGITKKVGNLLCLLQNMFVILGVILLIVQLITAMLGLGFNIPPCSSSDPNGCCSPDVCPAFLKDNSSGITSSTGFFQYYNEVGTSSGLTLPAGFPPIIDVIRGESWQFYDPNLPQNQQFINITNAFDLPSGTHVVFFPSGASYTDITDPSTVPYTVDFRLFWDSAPYGFVDPKGPRFIRIQKAIVKAPPTNGVLSFNGVTYIAPFDGTLNLIGGKVVEDDGTTPVVDANGNQQTITSFFHAPINQHGPIPLPIDGVLYSNLTYTFNINYEPLYAAALITGGCIPSVAVNRDFINATLSAQFNSVGVGLVAALLPTTTSSGTIIPATAPLPDVAATQNCVIDNINAFRQNMSIETANTLQNNLVACLNTLSNQTSACLAAVINSGFDPYTSTFSLDTAIQFTTRSIVVSVQMNESSGQNMAANLPASVASSIAAKLAGTVSLGSISSFTYDGYGLFNADITSSNDGNGTVKVAYNNTFLSTLSNPADITQSPSVSVKILDYTFVQSSATGAGEPQRDISDTARDVGV